MNDIDKNQKKLLKECAFPSNITFKNEKYTIMDRDLKTGYVDLKGRIGKKSFILKVTDEDNAYCALKINKPGLYDNDTARNEIVMGKKLSGQDMFVVPSDFDMIIIDEIKNIFNGKCCCFKINWVDGETLKSIIDKKPDEISLGNAIEYLISLLDAVSTLQQYKLKHDDLHVGNIMVNIQGTTNQHETIKIIDTGNLKQIDESTTYLRRREDFYNFVSATCTLRDSLFKRRDFYAGNLNFFIKIDELIKKLNDDDEVRALGENIGGHSHYQAVHKEIMDLPRNNLQETDSQRLSHPFDKLSVEYIYSNDLLLKLFVKYNDFYTDLIGEMPVIMQGPRGCGKSMAFRYVSTNTHLSCGDLSDELKNIPYIGIYISCSQLQSYISWITKEKYKEQPDYYRKALLTFFSLVLVIELIKTLKNIQSKELALQHYKTDINSINKLANKIFEHIKNLFPEDFLAPSGIAITSKILWLENFFLGLKGKISYAMLHNEELPFHLPEYYISEVGSMTYKAINRSYNIVYLLDDYTFSRVPKSVQLVFNLIIWERNEYQYFNISSEKNSFHKFDERGTSYEDSRDYKEVDMGYLILDNGNKKQSENIEFITNMVNCRLSNAGWKTTMDKIIGSSGDYKDYNKLANKLKNHHKGTLVCYYGIEVISYLWSGDISVILQLLNRLTKNMDKDNISTINASVQHKMIIELSRVYIDNLKNNYSIGAEISNIANVFGDYSNWMLKNNYSKENTPYIVSRIECSLDSGEDFWDELKKNGNEIYKIAEELIKRTVFIEMTQGRAKETDKVSTMRWQFKKIYYPGKLMSFGKSQHLNIKNIKQFIDFLTNIKDFLEKRKNNNNQLKLFNDE